MTHTVHIEHKSKHHRKRAHKFLWVVIVFLGLTAVVAGGVYFFEPIKSFVSPEVIPTATPLPPRVTKVLIPVVKFTSSLTQVTAASLQANTLLIVGEEYREYLPAEYTVEVVDPATVGELLKTDRIALLPPGLVLPSYKTLIVDGINPWSKDLVLEDYPFQASVIAEVDELDDMLPESKTVMFVGGEIINARAVDRLSLNKNNNYTYLFDSVATDIKTADLAITMLENPANGDPTPCTGCTTFVSDEKSIAGLETVGFDLLSLAGNHAGDGGQAAFKRTIELIAATSMKATGTGNTLEQKMQPAIIDIEGVRYGLLAADDIAYFYWLDNTTLYGTNKFSKVSNGITSVDKERVNMIQGIKTANEIDYLIVYMSWGIEYTNKPTTHQKTQAHALIDGGVDLVVASHPHWVQGVEFYNGKPIVYALGNFVFDQTHTLPTRQMAAANFYYYENELKSIELMPMQSCGYHQTSNNLTDKYLAGEITLEEVYNTPDSQGCLYWMPLKLKSDHPSYQQILDRIYQYSEIP